MVRELERITHNGVEWIVDCRLEQIRNTKNVMDYMEFNDIEDMELADKVGTIWAQYIKDRRY